MHFAILALLGFMTLSLPVLGVPFFEADRVFVTRTENTVANQGAHFTNGTHVYVSLKFLDNFCLTLLLTFQNTMG